MTSSVTRSSRSSNKKVITATNDNIIQKTKGSAIKKKKQKLGKKALDHEIRSKKQQQQQQQQQEKEEQQKDEIQQADKDNESVHLGKVDASQHPDYTRLMAQLDQSKHERLQRVQNWQRLERQSIHEWFVAQKRQAWNDFYFARKKVRSDLVQNVQNKITRLEQELRQLNVQLKTQNNESRHEYDEYWIPPERLYTIGSFVGGATNEEVDRDLLLARQPCNGNNTPNLVYSDYESRSTTDFAEEGEASCSSRNGDTSSPSAVSEHLSHPYSHHQEQHRSFEQQQYYQSQQRQSTVSYANQNSDSSNNHTNMIYSPYEFEELPQDRRRDWWSYRSTTTA